MLRPHKGGWNFHNSWLYQDPPVCPVGRHWPAALGSPRVVSAWPVLEQVTVLFQQAGPDSHAWGLLCCSSWTLLLYVNLVRGADVLAVFTTVFKKGWGQGSCLRSGLITPVSTSSPHLQDVLCWYCDYLTADHFSPFECDFRGNPGSRIGCLCRELRF